MFKRVAFAMQNSNTLNLMQKFTKKHVFLLHEQQFDVNFNLIVFVNMNFTRFNDFINFANFLQNLLNLNISCRHKNFNVSILKICSFFSNNVLCWINDNEKILIIYNEACDFRATKKKHDRFLNSFAVAFFDFKTIRAREKKIKKKNWKENNTWKKNRQKNC